MDHEFIIENTTEEERAILEKNGIDWYFDDFTTNDVAVSDREEYDRAISLLDNARDNDRFRD